MNLRQICRGNRISFFSEWTKRIRGGRRNASFLPPPPPAPFSDLIWNDDVMTPLPSLNFRSSFFIFPVTKCLCFSSSFPYLRNFDSSVSPVFSSSMSSVLHSPFDLSAVSLSFSGALRGFAQKSRLPKEREKEIEKGKGGGKEKEKLDRKAKEIRRMMKVYNISDEGRNSRETDDEEVEEEEEKIEKYNIAVYQMKMDEEVEFFKKRLADIRCGRLDPEIFDHIMVTVKGEKLPMSNLAQVAIRSATLVTLNVFDESLTNKVMHSLRLHNKTWNPTEENPGILKLQLPKVNSETREAMKKQCKERLEQFKLKLRQHRKTGAKEIQRLIENNSWQIEETNKLQTLMTNKMKSAETLLEAKYAELSQ